jgi:triosephosphate isomerase
MNNTEGDAISLVRRLMQDIRSTEKSEVLICPPFTSLSQIHKLLVSSPILLGAQNLSEQPGGAYTGEISPSMVAEFCSHVILGHSERRAYYHENDSLINQKVKAALAVNLIPLLCIGEQLTDRDSGKTAEVITSQMRGALLGIQVTDPAELIIAYEPVWAIGTGRSASAAETNDLIGGVIRTTLAGLMGEEIAQGIRVLYGGSVNSKNAHNFLSQPEIDGALVGGASLTVDSFLGIIANA